MLGEEAGRAEGGNEPVPAPKSKGQRQCGKTYLLSSAVMWTWLPEKASVI